MPTVRSFSLSFTSGHMLTGRLCPSLCSIGSVGCGCRCRPPAGVLSPGARDGRQTHRSFHPQRHLQTLAGAGPDCGGQRCHRAPGTDDPQPRRQTQGGTASLKKTKKPHWVILWNDSNLFLHFFISVKILFIKDKILKQTKTGTNRDIKI